jgi:signal transduction histidine kinase/ActR/RegA family two-component response regulator
VVVSVQSAGVIGKPMKLLTRLFALIILTSLPLIGIEVYDEIVARTSRAEEGKDQALRLVGLVAQEQSRVVEGARQLLTALSKTPAVRNGDVAACRAFLADLARSFPQYIGLVSIDLGGHPTCSGGRIDPPASLADRPYFKLALANHGLALGEYEVDDPTHQKAIYLAQPYHDAQGNVGGIVAAGLSLDWLNGEIARNPLPPKATVSIIDRQGTILARYPGAEQFVGTKIPNQSHSYMLSGGTGVQEALGFDGIARIYSYTPLPGGPSGLTLSVGLDKGELLKGSAAANRRDIIAIAGSCMMALLLAGIGARAFIGRPIRMLLDAAEHWRQGDLGARVPFLESRSEFGRLGMAFNGMAAAIGAREQELEHRVKERTDALEQAMQAQKVAEAALHESRKMETVGRLTGGVAHDFNNLLAAIVGNIELARAHLGPRHPELPRLDAAMQSANRGAALVQQLLAFARRQNLRPVVVDLNHHIRTCQDMLQRLLRSDVTVEIRLSPEAWLVRVDPNQLEAAILNLAINARDAMPNGGTLCLQTKTATFPYDGGELAGDFASLTVSDTGTGIPPEVLEKVFEPFFTTKDIGAGSGLGLSMVHGFVRQSSGTVAIESVVGQGTSVTLFLPRTTDAVKAIVVAAEEPVAGVGTILLVDDDVSVRSVTADLLEMTGYSVITADNSTEAIACFERHDSNIDILVTDLVLADGLDGIDLAASIRIRRPDLPVLLITGYSDALLDTVRIEGMPVLTKPFEHVALARAIQEAMRRSRQGPRIAKATPAFGSS